MVKWLLLQNSGFRQRTSEKSESATISPASTTWTPARAHVRSQTPQVGELGVKNKSISVYHRYVNLANKKKKDKKKKKEPSLSDLNAPNEILVINLAIVCVVANQSKLTRSNTCSGYAIMNVI